MPRYRILDQHGLNYVTCTIVGWVDVFTRKIYRDILIESLAYCRKEKGLMVCAYVIMSNHIHMIVKVEETLPLSEVLRDFKKHTSRQILEAIAKGNESRKEWMLHVFRYYARFNANNRTHQFWIQDNHPITQSKLAESGLHPSKSSSGRMGRKRGRLSVQQCSELYF